MFNALYNCRDGADDTCCDYHADGIYFTFVFEDGRCFEWNEERDRIDAL